MSEAFNLEIISPEKTLLKSETTEVTIPAYEGALTILKDHIALVTFLRPGLIKVKQKNNILKFYAEEGTVEFSNNKLLILSSSVNDIENFSREEIDKMLKEAEENFEDEKNDDKDKYILSYKISTLREISQ